MSLGPVNEVLSTHTPRLFEAAVQRAVALLRAGEVVALPTETVYGLAANVFDARAVARLFAVKGRPAHNPIIVHVSSLEMARRCAAVWPDRAERLAHSFWPGPLTVVVAKAPDVPDSVTAGGPTVGVRWPSHPLIQAVIRACGFPLAAPSANRSNEISPTTAEHVRRSLGGRVPLIVDGGQAQVGIESTVVDVSGDVLRLLRPGMIHRESIEAVLQARACEPAAGAAGHGKEAVPEPLRSPGMLRRHYSPNARVVVWEWKDEAELRARLEAIGYPRVKVQVIAHSRIPLRLKADEVCVVPHDAEAYARALYGEWHRCDEGGAECIVMEAVPAGAEWRGIRDRLERASAEA